MLSCVGPISSRARSNARPVSSAIRARLLTCAWNFVIFEKIGSCSVSWKPPRPIVALPVSGVIDDDRRMRPERRGGRRDEVRDAGPVLRDAHAVAPGHARVAVGHVARALLVRDRDEADAGERKEVERVHVRRADDAEHVLHAVARRASRRTPRTASSSACRQRPAAGRRACSSGSPGAYADRRAMEWGVFHNRKARATDRIRSSQDVTSREAALAGRPGRCLIHREAAGPAIGEKALPKAIRLSRLHASARGAVRASLHTRSREAS